MKYGLKVENNNFFSFHCAINNLCLLFFKKNFISLLFYYYSREIEFTCFLIPQLCVEPAIVGCIEDLWCSKNWFLIYRLCSRNIFSFNIYFAIVLLEIRVCLYLCVCVFVYACVCVCAPCQLYVTHSSFFQVTETSLPVLQSLYAKHHAPIEVAKFVHLISFLSTVVRAFHKNMLELLYGYE